MAKKQIRRINIGTSAQDSPLKIPHLTQIQHDSYEWLLREGLAAVLEEVFPIYDYTGKNYKLEVENLKVGDPKLSWKEAQDLGTTYQASIHATGKLTNLESGQTKVQEVYLGEIPLQTERGTFIINGVERVIVNQLTRAPGIYYERELDPRTRRYLYALEIRPERGSWVRIETNKDGTLSARINRGRKINATAFLKAFGLRQREINEIFKPLEKDREHSYIQATLEQDATVNQEEAYLEIYGKMRPGDPRLLENAADYFNNLFRDYHRFSLSHVGRYKINKRFNLNFPEEKEYFLLQKEDLIAAVRHLIELNHTQAPADNIDHLANRRIRSVGELVARSFRNGLLRLGRNVTERLSLSSVEEDLAPNNLINARPVVSVINEFFNTSQLSQVLEGTNPLSELEHLRTISVLGPGGLSRERAGPAVRDVHPSHFGRIDIVLTPEGSNVGLKLYLARYARVNRYGFLEAPYRKVEHKNGKAFITNEVIYLQADDEEQYKIAEATVERSREGEIIGKRVSVRHQGHFRLVPPKEVDLIEAHPSMITGVASGLMPYISSDAGQRAMTGSKMQLQAVPLIKPDAPRVIGEFSRKVIQDAGRSLCAQHNGTVEYVDSQRIEVRTEDRNLDVYYLDKFLRSNDNSCYNQKPIVKKGERVKKGQLLVDGPSSHQGDLALGANLLTAYMIWDGFNFEDAIVVSERVVKEDLLTSIHIRRYEVEVNDTKLGPEEVTRDIPNVSDQILSKLDEGGIVIIGAHVKGGDILVGKIAPKGVEELTAEERLLRAIFGEKAREVRDTSLVVPHGEGGVVIGIKTLNQKDVENLGPGVLQKITVYVAEKRKLAVGDKLSGLHHSKGVVSKIVPIEDMPYTEDGTPVDILLNPASFLKRMNVGQVLEAQLSWAGEKLNEYYEMPAMDKLPENFLEEKLKEAGLPVDGKVKLYDGRTGKPFDQKIAVGVTHILKLHHLVEDKMHARSTGPYSLVTQQPLGGKSQMGGQRVGEMEVWALESYGAAHTLQEMLTIKSDDVLGRSKAFESIIKGLEIPAARLPEAFKLLIKELNSLGLAVDTLIYQEDEKPPQEIDATRIIEEVNEE